VPSEEELLLTPQLPVLAKLTLSDLMHRSFGTSNDESKDLSAHVSSDGAASLVVDKEREKGASAFESGVIGFGTGIALFSSAAGVLLCIAGACTLYNSRPPSGSGASEIFIAADSLPESSALEVQQRLPDKTGYDCTFSRPISSRGLMRIRARILPPENTLKAPLTARSCVLYTASVQARVHEGVPATPVAFHARSVGYFKAALLDDPQLIVEIRGEDVSLFQMAQGTFHKKTSLARAPDRWYDFVRQRSTVSSGAGDAPCGAGGLGSDLSNKHRLLDFQETALLADAIVTIVGSIHRSHDSKLSVQPWHPEDADADADEEDDKKHEKGKAKRTKGRREGHKKRVGHNDDDDEDDDFESDTDLDLDLSLCAGDLEQQGKGLRSAGGLAAFFTLFPEIVPAPNSDDDDNDDEEVADVVGFSDQLSGRATAPNASTRPSITAAREKETTTASSQYRGSKSSLTEAANPSGEPSGGGGRNSLLQQQLCLAGRVFVSDDPVLTEVDAEDSSSNAKLGAPNLRKSRTNASREAAATTGSHSPSSPPTNAAAPSNTTASRTAAKTSSSVRKCDSGGEIRAMSAFFKWPNRSFWKDVAYRTGLSRFHGR